MTAMPGAADAKKPAAPVSLVAWSGEVGPEGALHGVLLGSDGKLTVLTVKPTDRGKGKISAGKSFTPPHSKLAAIRAAGEDAMLAPPVTVRNAVADGPFTAATISQGGKTRSVVGLYGSPLELANLVRAIDAVLPTSAWLIIADVPPPVAAAEEPGSSACPSGQRATSISRRLSLKEAAARGLLTLTAKGFGYGVPVGRFAGDSVAVDFHWGATAPGTPVVVRINLEVTSPDSTPWEDRIKTAVEGHLTGLRASDGTPLTFDINIHRRKLGDPPTPCFHEIALEDFHTRALDKQLPESYVRSPTGTMSDIPFITQPATGVWTTGKETAEQEMTWTHEMLHLAGLKDQYGYVFFSADGGEYPVPEYIYKADADTFAEWAKSAGVGTTRGIISRPPAYSGHEHDMMACCYPGVPLSSYHVFQSDIDWMARIGALRLSVHGNPGDLLVNKTAGQNVGVADPFDLDVGLFGSAHADGLIAYCIDGTKKAPQPGNIYDVLGPAGDQPGDGMQALQRVLQVISKRRPGGSAVTSADVTPGALGAVWRVTDDEDPGDDPPALAILAEARVDLTKTYATPHFTDPNASSTQTGAVTPDAVQPTPPPPPPDPALSRPAPSARLTAVRVRPRTARAPGTRVLTARVDLVGAEGTVTLRLQRRRGRHWRKVKSLPSRALGRGSSLIPLGLSRLAAGSYRLLVSVNGPTLTAQFTVQPRR